VCFVTDWFCADLGRASQKGYLPVVVYYQSAASVVRVFWLNLLQIKFFQLQSEDLFFFQLWKGFFAVLACVCYFINAKTPINVLYYIPEKCHYEVSNFAKICDTLVENILYVLFIGVHVNSTVLSAHFQRLALILQYIAFIRKRATV